MNILVCISKTPDTTSKISFIEQDKVFNSAGVQYILNPYDEWYALVKAVELIEAQGGNVTVINVGLADNEAIIRKALAIGANDAVRIDKQPENAVDVAFQIAEFAKNRKYDLILTGKETIDYNNSEVAAIIAELLDMPFVSYANELNVENSLAKVSREIEGGNEIIEVNLPIVVSCAKGMAEQRIPNMKGIMGAKSKPLEIINPTTFTKQVELMYHTLPPAKQSVKMIDTEQMDELVRLLHEEAKII